MAELISLGVFIYTICLLLLCAFSASICLCVFFVTRNCVQAAIAVLCSSYLLETAVAFSWGYAGVPGISYDAEGAVGAMLLIIQFALSFSLLASVAIVVQEHVNGSLQRYLSIPIGFLLAAAVLSFIVGRDQTLYQWSFLMLREAAVIALLAAGLVAYRRIGNELGRRALRDFAHLSAFCIGCMVATALFDTFVFLNTPLIASGSLSPWSAFFERNFFENLAVIVLCIHAMRQGRKTLALRFESPLATDGVVSEVQLARFVERFSLTLSERNVLVRVMEGKKIKVIASDLYISEGTVKTHLSHIYKKTHCANRSELQQAFWKFV